MEHYFECALQAAHSGAKGGSIQCAALFAHFADELGLKGGIIYVQNLTKGVAKEAWRDPAQDWLAGDPYRLPCELASDPGVRLSAWSFYSGVCMHVICWQEPAYLQRKAADSRHRGSNS